ncbi:hypothetical protein EI555_018178 [Monodon monoceros]|uniref:G-protein coupled receptors family 3 profile domain-containing protein n=1 Tax=Monodon monoceros TaxID=40151 RepID=A0A4V5PD42_MONMO|nr:hypothetical protein EI555_018178 [Monodon monoceros]
MFVPFFCTGTKDHSREVHLQVTTYEDCKESTGDYYFLCDTTGAWGIVLHNWHSSYSFATLAFLFLMRRVQDRSQWNVLPTQFLFLLGGLGLLSLAFAFLIQLNKQTAPIRYFLFGVLFAVCFSCLLTHASNLVKLVWGQMSSSRTTILCIAIDVSLLQTIIATEYVTLIMTRGTMFMDMTPCQLNVDFAVLLVYVLFLLALTFFVSKATFCGPCENWKRHRRLIFLTVLISIIIWVVWISMLTRGNPMGRPCPLHRPDRVSRIALCKAMPAHSQLRNAASERRISNSQETVDPIQEDFIPWAKVSPQQDAEL